MFCFKLSRISLCFFQQTPWSDWLQSRSVWSELELRTFEEVKSRSVKNVYQNVQCYSLFSCHFS